MFSFIPANDYTHYFDIAILLMILVASWQCSRGSIFDKTTISINGGWGLFFSVVLILYMGLRPISSVFGDTMNYAQGFYQYASSSKPFVWEWRGEWFYTNMSHWFAKHSDIHTFFLFCAAIYVGALWLASARIFRSYYYIPFLIILSMFSFWDYGVNGIRNGMGASLFILAMTFVNNIPIMVGLCLLAVGCHTSVYLMIASAVAAWFFKKTYYYLAFWCLSIPMSFAFGSRIQTYLAGLNLMAGDERLANYMTTTAEDLAKYELQTVITGFRWDFILYSAMAVVVGYYFIYRRQFKDEYYHWVYNTYLATNAFWILVIRTAYSNRFAQISWFIMPLVLIYPFMKQRFWQNHEKMLGYAILLFYAFSFYWNIIR